eukprot:s2568_g4.t1
MCGSMGFWLLGLLLFAGPSSHLADEALLEPPQIGAVPRELLGNFGAVVGGLAELLGLEEELSRTLLDLRDEEAEACAVLLLLADQALASPNYAAIGRPQPDLPDRLPRASRPSLPPPGLHGAAGCQPIRPRDGCRSFGTRKACRGTVGCCVGTGGWRQHGGLDNSQRRARSGPSFASGRDREVARWKPTLSSLRRLLQSELLMPLRALHECDVPAGGPQEETRALVEEVSRQMVEGNLRQWKFQRGALQLQQLNEDQLRGWFELGLLEH